MSTTTTSLISLEKIILPTDFTPSSDRALKYAKSLAKQFSAHLTVAHVCKPPERVAIPEGGWFEDPRERRRAEEMTEALAGELRAEGFKAEGVCAVGSVENTVASLAESRHADLLVAGTHGRVGFSRFVYGSRAESIARQVETPMLFVGPCVSELGKEAWTIKHVVCGISIRREAAPVAAYAYRFAATAGASLFVYYLDDARAPARSDERRAVTVEVRRYLEENGRTGLFHDFAYLHDHPAEELVKLAAKSRTDLIVLEAESHLLNLSRLHRDMVACVVTGATCPVLVMPSR